MYVFDENKITWIKLTSTWASINGWFMTFAFVAKSSIMRKRSELSKLLTFADIEFNISMFKFDDGSIPKSDLLDYPRKGYVLSGVGSNFSYTTATSIELQ